MKKDDFCLKNIPCELPPPEHTCIKPRCFTCKKFEVCNIRTDYLKTAKLIQNILGNPCDNSELINVPHFCGRNIISKEDYFPCCLKSGEKNGRLVNGKWRTKTDIKLLYGFGPHLVIYEIKGEETSIDSEKLFGDLNLDSYFYPSKTETISLITYHYKPIAIEVSEESLAAARKIIEVADGAFQISIRCSFSCIFGNSKINGEYIDRYPTEEEIKTYPDLIYRGHTGGEIVLNLIKNGDNLSVQNISNPIYLIRAATVETGSWDSTFKAEKISLTNSSILDDIFKTESIGFSISSGYDAYYPKIQYPISDEVAQNLTAAAMSFYNDFEEVQIVCPKDVINTTAFSARLECDHYEWEKSLSYEDGYKRIFCKYPNGIPLCDGRYYHIATYHTEPKKAEFMPFPYPMNCKPYKVIPPKYRRDQLNE